MLFALKNWLGLIVRGRTGRVAARGCISFMCQFKEGQGTQCLYSQERCHDPAWTLTSGIRDLIVANITKWEVMVVIVGDGKGTDTDLERARQRRENVDGSVIEVGHGWAVGATGQAGDGVENASECGRRGPDNGRHDGWSSTPDEEREVKQGAKGGEAVAANANKDTTKRE